jgi:hypothetical protein
VEDRCAGAFSPDGALLALYTDDPLHKLILLDGPLTDALDRP